MKRSTFLFLCYSLLGVFSMPIDTFAQPFANGKAVLQAAYEKTGGAKWDSVKTSRIITNVEIVFDGGAAQGTSTETSKYPNYQHTDQTMNSDDGSFHSVQVVTPDKAWYVSDEDEGEFPTRAIPSASAEKSLLQTEGNTYELSETTFNGKNVYAIKVSGKASMTRYYSKETLFLEGILSPSDNGDATIKMSDYRNVNGIWVWHKREITAPNGNVTTHIREKVEFNIVVDDALFQKK